ncbi:MAG: tyrosine--tRNA ligase [Gemmatimonadota bacterium]
MTTKPGTVFDELEWRGLIYDATEGARDALREPLTGYIGFDPTASSLHVGSLLPVVGLVHLQRHGHQPVALVGGGTGLIGDPSGKTKERQLLDDDVLQDNLAAMKQQLERLLETDGPGQQVKLINNANWLRTGLIEFLRDVGKHFTVNYMNAKESVRRRLDQQDGMTFTEYSYMLLQAYDYLELHTRHGCTLQLGGSDQWGNIVAGIDLIRRKSGARAHGVVFPLLESAAGAKFGKTEEGTIWLDAERTSPYQFYQFWLNTSDADVIRHLKAFTLLGQDEIAALEAETARAPESRAAQKELAEQVTGWVHGQEELGRVVRASAVLFTPDVVHLRAGDLLGVLGDVPSMRIPATRMENPGVLLVDLLATCGLAASKGEARRLLKSGGIYLNNSRVDDVERALTRADCIDGEVVLIRRGPKSQCVVRVDRSGPV